MLPDLSYFHFLRPGWALLILPWLALFLLRSYRENQPDMFGGIIAPHLLEHPMASIAAGELHRGDVITSGARVARSDVLHAELASDPLHVDGAALVGKA